MLTSLFGDLGLPRKAGASSSPSGLETEAGFAATAVLETTSAEVNDSGQMVDRHLRDLFVTGSPAQAMREHFATSRAELENAGKWIVLFDPARIWASAVVKALSDASGQPIDRLHLRDQGTLRTLAMIERTSIVRRLDDTLKIYHADVRASGRENAEISLALMERAHMTAVIVGPMQPHAIDAMLNMLRQAAAQPSWRCPSLLFLLPPGAVWISNKISGIAWPNGLRVHQLSESLTGASAVWNAVLGTWNSVKDTRPWEMAQAVATTRPDPTQTEASLRRVSPVPEPAVPVKLIPTPPELTGPDSTQPVGPLDEDQGARALTELMRTDGLLGCAIVETATGLVLARELRETASLDLDGAAAAAAQVLRTHQQLSHSMGGDEVEEVVATCGPRQQVLRVLSRHPDLFVLAVFDRGRTNISVARFRLMETEKSLL